ncbi:Lcl domain-containing protein [Leptospira sanjuanensis]|uniref:Lcl domain-containing protein n=1 Tax=Leptospira sanjuanensis TaxID=2879643 RepID=UPI001EE97D4F|nr:DUF1566 domain-containing protein [Leptospira sanjuanensis]MCG6169270.1 DUF1566 domain-containing protein [Leptospira sanjuanensis]
MLWESSMGQGIKKQHAKLKKEICLLYILFLCWGIAFSNCLVGEGKKGFNFFFLPGSSISNPGGGIQDTPILTTPVAPQGSITYSSATTFYVSNNAGAIQYYDISWSSSLGASYELRKGATNCSDGSVHTSGSVTASTSNTDRINASDLSAGSNGIKLCLKSPDGTLAWDTVSINGIRDDVAPTIGFSPAGGTYGSSVPNITLSCTDTGASGCLGMAFRNDGTNPGIAADGTVASGSTGYSSAFAVANNATTDVKVIAVDKAGNISAVSTSQYVVAVGNPTITINSVSKADMRSVDSSVVKWQSDLAGNYDIRVGGTDCNSGTNGSSLSLTGSAAANTEITTTISGAAPLAVGANTIRICLTTAGSNVGSNSTAINIDNTAPTLTSATPANNSTSLSVDQNTFVFTFNEDMDQSLKPLPEHHDSGVSGNPQIAWPTMAGTWTDARTYSLALNSKLPELHTFYLQFTATGFKDKAGNAVGTTPVAIVGGVFKLNYKSLTETKVTLVTDTAQTNCYDSSGNAIACAGSGQDSELSVMPYGLGVPTTNPGYPNDRITRDTVNNVIWKTCPPTYVWSGATCVQDAVDPYNAALIARNMGSGILDLTWGDSLEYCLQLNLANSGAGFAGVKTWRLPTLSEQMSILTYEGSIGNETIQNTSFPGFIKNDYQRYWTSTNAVSASIALNGYTGSELGNGSNAWGAWQISVFGGGTHINSKGKATSWNWPNRYMALAMCIAD